MPGRAGGMIQYRPHPKRLRAAEGTKGLTGNCMNKVMVTKMVSNPTIEVVILPKKERSGFRPGPSWKA
jgi:hypothetical protein